MKRWFLNYVSQFTISGILRSAFVIGTLLTLIVSSISLYAWQAQNRQIRYALGDYFPRIQASFLFEGQLNTLVDELNEFLKTPNTASRLQLRNQITARLSQIEFINQQLAGEDREQIAAIVSQSQSLLQRLDNALYNMFLAREKLNTLSARITWLHDDFNTELSSLSQDISWQQGSLLDQLEQDPERAKTLQLSLRKVQGELQLIYTLARLENQIVEDLTTHLRDVQSNDANEDYIEGYQRYLNYLKASVKANEPSLNLYPSAVTLEQTIDELLEIGVSETKMSDVLRSYLLARTELQQVTEEKERILARFHTQLEAQLGSSHRQLQTFNQHLANIMSFSGTTIIVAAFMALLLAFLFNHYFIRSRLVKRFTELNKAVARIGCGDLTANIPVTGRDEIGRIAGLIRQTINQINQQKNQLEQEITERKAIEDDLRSTQNELIQTAKLAVVGQTMTTLAHEINQPLNALTIHLFMAQKAVDNNDSEQAANALAKSTQLVSRMDAIIRSLRQFARRRDEESQLLPIDLKQSIQDAWAILALQHKTRNVTLTITETLPQVLGDAIGIQQVVVNLLANALDASPSEAVINIDIIATEKIAGDENNKHDEHDKYEEYVEIAVTDNGSGWSLSLTDNVLKPFITSKEIGLGIGLSVSSSIMQQLGGELRIASTLTHNGCVILRFKKVN